MLMYPDHCQNWLDFGHSLLIIPIVVQIWFNSGLPDILWTVQRKIDLKYGMLMHTDHLLNSLDLGQGTVGLFNSGTIVT